jgi:hypothetical protein
VFIVDSFKPHGFIAFLQVTTKAIHLVAHRICLIAGYLMLAGLIFMPTTTLLVMKAFGRLELQDQGQLIRQAILLLVAVAIFVALLPNSINWLRAQWQANPHTGDK